MVAIVLLVISFTLFVGGKNIVLPFLLIIEVLWVNKEHG